MLRKNERENGSLVDELLDQFSHLVHLVTDLGSEGFEFFSEFLEVGFGER